MAICKLLAVSMTVANSEMNFLIMGDWGGFDAPIYSTPGEHASADAMAVEAGKINASFCLTLGDNFYENGIPTDEHSARFKRTFEDVFDGSTLKADKFFRVVGGNHDHKGNITAQIAYSAHSSRWHYPDLWYNFVEDIGDGATAEFVMIDTVVLSGPSACPITNEDWLGSDERMDLHVDAKLAQTQYEWLEATLANSKADFLFVSGHYPVYSVCEHGPTSSLQTNLKPLLEKYRVSAYFAGHDHCEEHIDDSSGVQYHVVGAGDILSGSNSNKDKVPAEHLKYLDIGIFGYFIQGGFARVSVSKKTGAVVTHFRTGTIGASGYEARYRAEPIPARSTTVV